MSKVSKVVHKFDNYTGEIDSSGKKLLELAEAGDFSAVKRLVDRNVSNVNYVDYQGNTILHYALKHNNENMVKYLFKIKDLDVKDCLFHAIKSNQLPYVELILDKLEKDDPSGLFAPSKVSVDFPRYMTPLMLAAKCGHFDIMQYLNKRGHPQIPVPHEPQCMCRACLRTLREGDPLEVAMSKLVTLEAICNPFYIVLVSEDPIYTVFLRVEELNKWADFSRVFFSRYKELIEKTEIFAAELVSLCRTSDEVKTILSAREGCDSVGSSFPFPRLLLAVDNKQHRFVAQTNVQAVLESAWLGDWYDWRSYSDIRCTTFFFGRVITLVVVCPLYLLFPNSSSSVFYSFPVNRMISSLASYFIFLFLLFLESNRDKTGETRYELTHHKIWQILIFFFVVAHILNSFRMWLIQGTDRFFSFMWNWYDLFTQLMFALTFAFLICALITLKSQPDLERKYWHYLDPQLLAEGLFCIGTVMAYLRLLLLIQMHHTLGPMQISMGKMTRDFSKFVVIFGIVVGSFTVGMCRLYEYYDGMKQVDPDTEAESIQESSFVSFYDTFKVLFWGLFTMSSQDAATVVIENLPTEGADLEDINSHDFTQAVGYGLFGVYMALTVIVIMNMLIAAMSNTYQSVTDNVDVQWIFGRTEVYLIFMAQTVVPPPFSMIPALGRIFWVFFRKTFNKKTPEKTLAAMEDRIGSEMRYNKVMKDLIKRYLSLKEDEEESG